MTLRTLGRSLVAATLVAATANASAVTYNVLVTGDGWLTDYSDYDNYDGTNVGLSSLSFSFDTDDFFLESSPSGSWGSGRRFGSTPGSVIDLDAGGVSYSLDPFDHFSYFDQPSRFDQVSFGAGGGVFMQWNDSSSSAFSGALSGDFETAVALAVEQIETNAALELANGSVRVDTLDGNYDLSFELRDAVVTFSTGVLAPMSVPAPAPLVLLGIGLLGLARRR